MLFLLFVISILILVGIEVYPLFINFILKRKKTNFLKSNDLPSITMIIPSYNEKEYIRKKLKNTLSLDYPKNKLSIIVVDSSTDKTADIIRKFKVDIIMTKRKGKIHALNTGIRKAKTDIVIISDADVIVSKNSLKKAVSLLRGNIGAVGGFTVLNKKHLFYYDGKKRYNDKDWMMRHKESILGSPCGLDGKFIAFRKSIVKQFPQDTIIDDFELTFLIKKKGYNSLVSPTIKVYETPLNGFHEELKQMRRRTAYTISTLRKYYYFLFNPKYSYFGLIILPFRRFFTLFVPFFLIYVLFYIFLINVLLFTALVTLLFIATIIKYKKASYYYILLISIVLAWYDVMKRTYKPGGFWDKMKR